MICRCGHLRVWHTFLRGACQFHCGGESPGCGCGSFRAEHVRGMSADLVIVDEYPGGEEV